MKKQYLILFLLVIFCACKNESPKKIRIGFSQCVGSDLWRQSMLDAMHRELSFYNNIELIYRDADNNSDVQNTQIKELAALDIDLLIVSPNEASPLTPTIEQLYKEGLPVIITDRRINSSQYTSFIGGDNYEIGRRVGEYAANHMGGKGLILEVTGLPGSSPAIDRNKGFADALANHTQIKTIPVHGDWLKDKAINALKSLTTEQLASVNLVFAHNEVMALGAYEYFTQQGLSKAVSFIGVDGLPGIGLKYVSNKIFLATALYPTGGEEAIKTAMAILQHKNFQKENLLQTVIIDSSNVRIMIQQAFKIDNQQSEITRQQSMITNQRKIYDSQNTALYVTITCLAISILLGGMSFYFLRENKRFAKRLLAKNEEITKQQEQLVIMSEQARMASEARTKFFTNISHEFRTPLTLILAPLEDMIEQGRLHYNQKQSLTLVQKNVIRLLRLINQLMDFRKIELDKLKLHATENDLVAFTRDIVETFHVLAIKRNIDFRLITDEKQLIAWFDINMIDKVLFNLLSNAFKFTNDDGQILVNLICNRSENTVTIKVDDNGIGMEPEAVDHAFELFYNSEITSQQGSGLGLSLSKELIGLHHGSIGVKSTRWQGTSFEIILPLGKDHLRDNEVMTDLPARNPVYEDEKIFITELQDTSGITEESNDQQILKEKRSVLVIEDNSDLRKYLVKRLQDEYEVFDAENGVIGLELAYSNIPDLIISDIVLPDKNGLAITHQLKTDIRTSHIPVILLTSRTTIDNQIEGMRSMADAYLVKPFNVAFLNETIKNMLINRDLLRDHYTSELPVDKTARGPKKLDRKFINDFTAIVENNIGNEKFTADDLCKIMGISRVQLYRKVKALLGVNINEYMILVRLQRAKHLLQEDELTISEVAYKVGFSSAAYFSTVFKSRFNQTPSE
ncbi:MAG: substrate-binding domain-containing protein, partial [Flavitalea sp.]